MFSPYFLFDIHAFIPVLMQRAQRRSKKYQFYSLWFDPTIDVMVNVSNQTITPSRRLDPKMIVQHGN
jgi:hypothetical protein